MSPIAKISKADATSAKVSVQFVGSAVVAKPSETLRTPITFVPDVDPDVPLDTVPLAVVVAELFDPPVLVVPLLAFVVEFAPVPVELEPVFDVAPVLPDVVPSLRPDAESEDREVPDMLEVPPPYDPRGR